MDRWSILTTYVPGDEEEYGIYREKRSRFSCRVRGGSPGLVPSRAQLRVPPAPPTQPGSGSQGPPAPTAVPRRRESSRAPASDAAPKQEAGEPPLVSRSQLMGNCLICGMIPTQPRSCFRDRGILTELALLGFGHGLPAPGPLGSKLNRKKKKGVFLSVQSRKARAGSQTSPAWGLPYMLIPGMPGPRELGGGLMPLP